MNAHEFLALLILCVSLKYVKAEIWPHHAVLDDEGKFNLYWKPPDDKSSDSEIIFKVEVAAKGYVGVGLSPNGNLPGSDIVTGWVKHGETYFQDRYATGDTLPMLDEKQNWILMHGRENLTHTILVFRRKLDTCDEKDMVIDDSTMRVIYAFSDVDPMNHLHHYQHRGSKSVMLLRYQFPYPQPDPFMKEWFIKANNFDISAYESIYWCKIFKSPQLHTKHHVVHVKPTIQEGHESFVHHFVLYECVDGTPEEFEGLLDDDGYDCNVPTGNPPPQVNKCDGTVVGWGDGGGAVFYPQEAGLALEASPKYYKLETHYNNPGRMRGIFDNSGLRLFYTPHLRQYDSGAFYIGATILPRVFIPPSLQTYIWTGHGNPDCFGPAMSPEGIKIYGVILHTHLRGTKVKLRHFRGHKELPPIAMDNNYDSHFQEYRYLKDEVRFLPGDQMTIECTYNTSTRYTTTFGGQTTRDEMCLAMIYYYPAMKRYFALSAPTLSTINEALDTDFKANTDVFDLFNYNWSTVNTKEVEYHMRNSEHYNQCWLGNGVRNGVQSLVSYPSYFDPYVPPKSWCDVEKPVLPKHGNYRDGDGYLRMPLQKDNPMDLRKFPQ